MFRAGVRAISMAQAKRLIKIGVCNYLNSGTFSPQQLQEQPAQLNQDNNLRFPRAHRKVK
jgi:hypothetical protein